MLATLLCAAPLFGTFASAKLGAPMSEPTRNRAIESVQQQPEKLTGAITSTNSKSDIFGQVQDSSTLVNLVNQDYVSTSLTYQGDLNGQANSTFPVVLQSSASAAFWTTGNPVMVLAPSLTYLHDDGIALFPEDSAGPSVGVQSIVTYNAGPPGWSDGPSAYFFVSPPTSTSFAVPYFASSSELGNKFVAWQGDLIFPFSSTPYFVVSWEPAWARSGSTVGEFNIFAVQPSPNGSVAYSNITPVGGVGVSGSITTAAYDPIAFDSYYNAQSNTLSAYVQDLADSSANFSVSYDLSDLGFSPPTLSEGSTYDFAVGGSGNSPVGWGLEFLGFDTSLPQVGTIPPWEQSTAFAITTWETTSDIDLGPFDLQLPVRATVSLIGPGAGVTQPTYQAAVRADLGIELDSSDLYDPVLVAQVSGIPQLIQQLNANLNSTLPWTTLDLWPLLSGWFDQQGDLDLFVYLEIHSSSWQTVATEFFNSALANLVGDLKDSPSSILDTVESALNDAILVANIGGGIYGGAGVGANPELSFDLKGLAADISALDAIVSAYEREIDLLDFTGQTFLGEVWDGVRAAITAFDLLFDLVVPSSEVTSLLDDFTTYVDPPSAAAEPSVSISGSSGAVLGWTGSSSPFSFEYDNVGIAFGNGSTWEMIVARNLTQVRFGLSYVGSGTDPVPYLNEVGSGPMASPAVAAGLLTPGQSVSSGATSSGAPSGVTGWTYSNQVELQDVQETVLTNGSTVVTFNALVAGSPAGGVLYLLVNGTLRSETNFTSGSAKVLLPWSADPTDLYVTSPGAFGAERTVGTPTNSTASSPAGIADFLPYVIGAAGLAALAGVLIARRKGRKAKSSPVTKE